MSADDTPDANGWPGFRALVKFATRFFASCTAGAIAGWSVRGFGGNELAQGAATMLVVCWALETSAWAFAKRAPL